MGNVMQAIDGCWYWIGASLYKNGNPIKGVIVDKSKIPEKFLVCHSCDNPLCVNPDHLFLGTYKDNFNDMVSKKRDKMNRTGKYTYKRLSIDDVIEIRSTSDGYSKIVKKYGISLQTAVSIKKRRTYKNII